jgi:hypothetical protein
MTDDDIPRAQAERNHADAYGDAYLAAVSPNWEPDDPRTFPAQEALTAAMEAPFDARRRAALFAALADIATVRAAEEARD